MFNPTIIELEAEARMRELRADAGGELHWLRRARKEDDARDGRRQATSAAPTFGRPRLDP